MPEPTTNIISRDNLAGLIPQQELNGIMQGAIENSAVLRVGTRLPNMTAKTQSINVLDMLPTAYFVNGDTGYKQTSAQAWKQKRLYAEEVAVIIPIPEAVLDDANYDIWGQVRPRIGEAFGKVIDGAIIFGENKPDTWRKSIYETASDAGAIVTESVTAPASGNNPATVADLYQDLLGVGGLLAKVEESGYFPTHMLSDISMRAKLRGLVDANKNPIFVSNMQQRATYALDGTPLDFPMNGAWDKSKALMIAGDFHELVYSIRQDITFKILTEATIIDPSTKEIVYALAQQDMVALRAVMRLGWEIPNPVSAYRSTLQAYSPFAVFAPAA